MGELQVHTVYGWQSLEDLIPATIKCDKCGEKVQAQGAGFVKSDPVENIIYFCEPCRGTH